jgi:hypothetical protein
MAWTSAALTSQEVSDALADNPLLAGAQQAESFSVARWVVDGVLPCGVAWSTAAKVVGNMCDSTTRANQLWRVTAITTGTPGASEPTWPASPTVGVTTQVDGGVTWTYQGNTADDSATNSPASNATDRRASRVTKPTTARLIQYLALDLGSTFAADVDLAAVIGANLGAISADGSGTLTVALDVADDSAFVTGKQTVWTQTVAGDTKNQRLVSMVGTVLGLAHTGAAALRYTGARFWRLKISRASGTFIPQIGDLWLGRRRQMRSKPLLPADPDATITNAGEHKAASGPITRYIYSSGQASRPFRWWIVTNAEATDLASWWSESKRGKAFLFILKPTTAPRAALIMLSSLEFSRPVSATTASDYQRRWEPTFVEQDTFYDLET